MEGFFTEISLIIILAVLVAGVVRFLKQPLIIAYILAGILASPYFFDVAPSGGSMQTFAHIGIAFLLFMVGLNLNPKIIKDVGRAAVITGIGQVLFTTLFGFLLGKAFGFSDITALYVAVAVSFSSTIIIMKLLSDKGDVESLYGRISVGFLIVQDLIAIVVLLFISSFSSGASASVVFLQTIAIGMLLLCLLAALSVSWLPRLTASIAKSQEYLLLFSIGWCFAVAFAFASFGFSIEIGALLAGVSLALSPYRYEIASRMKPIRDFFLVLFFVYLGSQLAFENLSGSILAIISFSLLILIGNPLIVIFIMGRMGYSKKSGFLAGLTVAQISEFSLILVTLGITVGHLDNEILSILTVVGLITITGCTYMVLYSQQLFTFLSPFLSFFERKGTKIDEHKYHHDEAYDILLLGYNRVGYDLVHSLRKLRKEFLIVDYNPEVIKNLAKEGFHCRYGDASDSELLNELNLHKAKMVISSIGDLDTNLLIIRKIKSENKKVIFIAVSHQIDEAMKLYNEGASYVIMPHYLGGQHASLMIEDNKLDLNKFLKHKVAHIEYLKKRHKMRHVHPVDDKKD